MLDEDVSVANFALHAQNFASATEKNIVPKFTNRLSRTLHKICKYKGSLRANFSGIWTKYVPEKTRTFAYFTQCGVFHLLAQKFKHYWTRIIAIILKITNCSIVNYSFLS